jgi:dipeptidyl aminopeptidase/acylaminoacyl peptidase
VIGYSSHLETIIFAISSQDSGSSHWACDEGTASCRSILEVNTFLKDVISTSEMRKITYRALDGRELFAGLMLPMGYQAGLRYPLITWVYAGHVSKDNHCTYPMLPAHGYAVLCPSMPLPPVGVASDPYMEMLNGVMPAVDKVIEMGIADPERLGIMGHSYGGYSVYSIISQTTRFKAAVASAGPAELVSYYVEFEALSDEAGGSEGWAETGQGRMGSPPWKDAERYIRNSPIFHADRIETPLMIVQGDKDLAVPIEQGAEMFSAMKRQNKRAEFVRYWGEDHTFSSPENERDEWMRIYEWFDEFLKGPQTPRPSPPDSSY